MHIFHDSFIEGHKSFSEKLTEKNTFPELAMEATKEFYLGVIAEALCSIADSLEEIEQLAKEENE